MPRLRDNVWDSKQTTERVGFKTYLCHYTVCLTHSFFILYIYIYTNVEIRIYITTWMKKLLLHKCFYHTKLPSMNTYTIVYIESFAIIWGKRQRWLAGEISPQKKGVEIHPLKSLWRPPVPQKLAHLIISLTFHFTSSGFSLHSLKVKPEKNPSVDILRCPRNG